MFGFRERRKTFSIQEWLLHYIAIFDLLIGFVLLFMPLGHSPDFSWEIGVIAGTTEFWSFLFILTGTLAGLGNITRSKIISRAALSLSAGLGAGRGVSFLMASWLLWPEFAAILVSGSLVWFKQAAFIWSVAKYKESRIIIAYDDEEEKWVTRTSTG